MKVWLIRHGQSETNSLGLWTGWLDTPLTERGREEAARVRDVLSGIRFDQIYSSDLCRATSTAEIALPGLAYETSPLFREINVGDLAGKPHRAVLDEQGKPMNTDGYGCFGGESAQQFRERVMSVMRSLESETGEHVAVFSHWGVIKQFLSLVLGMEIPKRRISGNNCLVAVFEYGNGQWSLHSWINLL